MPQTNDFTHGRILSPLLRFMLPVLMAMFLQSMYGAVDLMIVGKFAEPLDVSAVSTGSQIMMTITNLVTSFAMGTTILLGRRIGEGNAGDGGRVIGSSICLFAVIAVLLTAAIPLASPSLSRIMHAPEEAFASTVSYTRICGFGSLFIIAYNLIGSIFRTRKHPCSQSLSPAFSISPAIFFWSRSFTWALPAQLLLPLPRRHSAWSSPSV